MKIVDAIWEKRNLGVTTQEITLDGNEDIVYVEESLKSLDAEYQVVKVPTGKIDIMWKLEELGFKYIETTYHVINDLKNLELPRMLKRLDESIIYEKMEDEDLEVLFDEIRNGLFYTDRIALDRYFSKKQAADRYIGWISDEINRGTEIYKNKYKGKNIGFFTFKEIDEGIYYPFLAGVYKEYQNSPLGMLYLYKPLVEAKKRNGKRVSTYISTNNANAVRMHVQFGFQFMESTNVYVKHINS